MQQGDIVGITDLRVKMRPINATLMLNNIEGILFQCHVPSGKISSAIVSINCPEF